MRVTFLATGTDQDCGIATYTTSLEGALDVETDRVSLQLRSLNVLHYAAAGWRAGRTDADVLHVQHEYGIYGPKSINSWALFTALWLATLFRDLPIVVTCHTAWNRETIGPPLVSIKRVYVRLNNRLVAGVADHVIFLSEATRDAFAESADVEPSTVLAHGVQTETHPMDAGEAKAEFGYDADEPLVVEPGYVRPQKGYETFVAIARELPEVSFLIGGGVQDADHEDYAAGVMGDAPENVAMTGVLEDERFHALFNAADVAVLPYEVVTQSGIVNWCVAYDVPVVASDLGRFEELHAEHGFPRLFPAGDAAAGAAAVRTVLDDPEPLEAALAAYRESHGMADVAGAHAEIYRRLLADDAPKTDN